MKIRNPKEIEEKKGEKITFLLRFVRNCGQITN